MNPFGQQLLNVVAYLPLAGALLLLFFPKERTKGIAYFATAVTFAGFVVSLPLWWGWGAAAKDAYGFRFVQEVRWIDAIGARYRWPFIHRRLRQRGVPAALFLPQLTPVWLPFVNLRNHRKILVVDGRVGFTGGMNIRDTFMPSERRPLPFADLQARVEGPVVTHLQSAFAEDWLFTTGESLDGSAFFPPAVSAGPVLARGIPDGPDEDFETIRWVLLGAIAAARRRIRIVTPYFLPDQPLITALNVAALRGVEVDVILPEQGNLPIVQWAQYAQLWQVLDHGCRVFTTPRPFDHTKAMTVDGAWSLVGSANWDPRSLRLNFELEVEAFG